MHIVYVSGAFCIIVSPTRELATQTFSVLQDITSYFEFITSALIIGGENRKLQSLALAKGMCCNFFFICNYICKKMYSSLNGKRLNILINK